MPTDRIRITGLERVPPDRRSPPATLEGTLEEIAKLREDIHNLEELLGGMMHGPKNFTSWVSPGLRVLRDDQEPGSDIREKVVVFAELGNQAVRMLKQTISLAETKIAPVDTDPEILLEHLRHRYKVLQHIVNNDLPSITERFEQLYAAIESFSREGLKDTTDPPILDEVSQGLKLAIEFLKEKNSEMKGHHREQLLFVDVGQLISDLKSHLDDVRRDLGVKIELILPQEKIESLVQPLMLDDIIVNLVVNAKDASADATPENKIVTVSLSLHNDPGSNETFILLKVVDRGSGMDEETRTKIFGSERFTKKGPNGSGFGLVAIRKFVSESNGRMEVESEPGKGTTFSIYLPLLRRRGD